jgi:Pup-ligase protein
VTTARQAAPPQPYQNNVDGMGAGCGTHEDDLMSRTTPFPSTVSGLIPFFVSRQVVTGSGRVAIGEQGGQAGLQLSRRADYLGVEVGLEKYPSAVTLASWGSVVFDADGETHVGQLLDASPSTVALVRALT